MGHATLPLSTFRLFEFPASFFQINATDLSSPPVNTCFLLSFIGKTFVFPPQHPQSARLVANPNTLIANFPQVLASSLTYENGTLLCHLTPILLEFVIGIGPASTISFRPYVFLISPFLPFLRSSFYLVSYLIFP